MKILYIAVSCDPYNGSEDKIGWNVPWECAKTNSVWVITRFDLKESIEMYLSKCEKRNIKFVYVKMPIVCQKFFTGMLQSAKLPIWHRKAFPIAKKLCNENKIDLIHQITPIEFRAIGDYGKIENVKFVVGPLGGGEFIPRGLRMYARKHIALEVIRAALNHWSRFLLNATGKMKRCDYIMFANTETMEFLIGGAKEDKLHL